MPARLRTPLLQLVRDQRIAHDADAVRVGQGDRGGPHPGLANPLQTGQLTVAVEAVGTSEQRLPPERSRRQDHRHPGANRAPADVERAVTLDQRRVTHPHTGHVGDRVVGPSRSLADDDSGFARAYLLAGPTHLSDSLIARVRYRAQWCTARSGRIRSSGIAIPRRPPKSFPEMVLSYVDEMVCSRRSPRARACTTTGSSPTTPRRTSSGAPRSTGTRTRSRFWQEAGIDLVIDQARGLSVLGHGRAPSDRPASRRAHLQPRPPQSRADCDARTGDGPLRHRKPPASRRWRGPPWPRRWSRRARPI